MLQQNLTTKRRILFIFGTRPEAIKLCPVVNHLRSRPEFDVQVCVTAQHRALLDKVLAAFEVVPDFDLDIMLPNQTLSQSTSRILAALEPVLKTSSPDMVLVQGDTTTTFCGGLAAFYQRIPVGHVEAGLRTWDLWQPFPEEMNRVLTTRLTALHFAATDWAAENLYREGIPDKIVGVTGNSGIDAVLYVRDRLAEGKLSGPEWPQLDPSKKLVVVTAHRRESFGKALSGSVPRSPASRNATTCRSFTRCIQTRTCRRPSASTSRAEERGAAGAFGIRAVCGPDAAGLDPGDRLRWSAGRGAVLG